MQTSFDIFKIFSVFLLDGLCVEGQLLSVFIFLFRGEIFVGFVVIDDKVLSVLI